MSKLFQILDQHGAVVGPSPEISGKQLTEIFAWMIRTRAFDKKATALRRQGRIGEYYGSEGQEAIVGAAAALEERDWIYTAYREHGAWFYRGIPYKAALEMFKGLPVESWDSERFRVTRTNATIGTHLPHATGHAHAARLLGSDEVTLCIFGDGATSESDFHAGLNFAGVWKAPVVFLCQNNLYAQSVSLANQTAGVIADKAIGYGFPGVRVDGMDPLAVHQATRQALDRARVGEGPTLIEMLTYRYQGHATYEANPLAYRPDGEPEAWMAKDPIDRMRIYLAANDVEVDEEELIAEVNATCDEAMTDLESRGLPARTFAIDHTYHRLPPDVVAHLATVQADLGESPADVPPPDIWVSEPEKPLPEGSSEQITHVEAVRRALLHKMRSDESMICIGEDVAADGGPFKATEGFLAEFGSQRVIDSPLSETGIIGTAVGMAARGARVMAEIQFRGFVYPAFDQIVGHVARTRWRYQGSRTTPIVIRMPGGTGYRGHEFHMDSPEAIFFHMPGIALVTASDPVEAKGLLASALEYPDPVMFFEPIGLYRTQRAAVPDDHYTIPIGRARVASAGSDVTVVAYGRQVVNAIAAAKTAEAEGISVEVIDLRTIRPWDREAVFDSIRKTGRLVTVHDAHRAAGVGAEIAATVAENLIYHLDAPIIRVAGFDALRPTNAAETLGEVTAEWILGGVRRSVSSP